MIRPDTTQKPFNLIRWFGVMSFVTITLVSVALALIVSHFLTKEILDRDALLTAQFVQSLTESEGMHLGLGVEATVGEMLDESFDNGRLGLAADRLATARAEFLQHFYNLPDVLLANVFNKDRRVVWSTNPVLIGRVLQHNEDLDEAFRKRTIVARTHNDARHDRDEQIFVGEPEKFFIENYIPLFDSKGDVATVVEVYKEPKSLSDSIRRGYVLVWACTVSGAFVSYLALFWIIRRASALIEHQKQRLVESETLAVIGEMSSAVAHSIRNPLASIRSSAELGLEADDPQSVGKNLRDIVSQADRIGRWIRDLLVFSRPLSSETEPVMLDKLIRECLVSHDAQVRRGGIEVDLSGLPGGLAPVHGNRALMGQVFNSVISNAIEAMPAGGLLRISAEPTSSREIAVVVADTGAGMSPAQLEHLFKPFYTTKRSGLGLGLALVKRIMERFGGSVRVASREKEGTQVRLAFMLPE
jgi:signal transduction histidine kinase